MVPGAGHFLLGAFRRGAAWVVGLSILGNVLLFTTPASLWIVSVPIAVVVGLVGRVAMAIDTARIVAPKPPWKIVMVAWAALVVGDLAVAEPLKRYYRTHHAQTFTIPSGTMQPTLLVGDYIVVDKSTYRVRAPQRGDIVVFHYPPDERRYFIKRIVGTPGDVVQVEAHQVLVNGQILDEPYTRLTSPSPPGGCAHAYACEPTRVPAGSYFVLGDKRDISQDSRHWGFVRREKIMGRAVTVYWSWDSERHRLRSARIGRSL